MVALDSNLFFSNHALLVGNGAERVGFECTVLQRLGALSGLALVHSDEVSISLKVCAAIRRQLKFG
jgi:hypothetical protein